MKRWERKPKKMNWGAKRVENRRKEVHVKER